jgi:hypothetical protein
LRELDSRGGFDFGRGRIRHGTARVRRVGKRWKWGW